MSRLECAPEHAPKMLEWIAKRGGVAVWPSVNLANLGASWSSPALTEDGSPSTKPSWQADSTPSRVITETSEIDVVTRREVKRFRVGVRLGSQGMSFKVTDGGSRRIDKELRKAGVGSSYRFDFETQEAVITVPGEIVPLDKWSAP